MTHLLRAANSSLKRALQRVDAGPNGKNTVFWTSLREARICELYPGGACADFFPIRSPLFMLRAGPTFFAS